MVINAVAFDHADPSIFTVRVHASARAREYVGMGVRELGSVWAWVCVCMGEALPSNLLEVGNEEKPSSRLPHYREQ